MGNIYVAFFSCPGMEQSKMEPSDIKSLDKNGIKITG